MRTLSGASAGRCAFRFAASRSGSDETAVFSGRRFCQACRLQVFSIDAEEAEVKVGIISEAPSPLVLTSELWSKRREP